MNILRTWYNILMRMNKDGTPDKRFKRETMRIESTEEELLEEIAARNKDREKYLDALHANGLHEKGEGEELQSLMDDLQSDQVAEVEKSRTMIHKNVDGTVSLVDDPNDLHERLLRQHNLQLDFDVVDGVVSTKHGFIKLDKPTLVVKATYGERK